MLAAAVALLNGPDNEIADSTFVLEAREHGPGIVTPILVIPYAHDRWRSPKESVSMVPQSARVVPDWWCGH